MVEFIKYPHLEKFGNSAVDGIEFGEVYVFPKIDGTNGQIFKSNNQIYAASRNRVLTKEYDNAGFYNWVLTQQEFCNFFIDNPNLILYGEWLVPHTLKTYYDDSWKKFYIFDVFDTQKCGFLPYDVYSQILSRYPHINFITPTFKVNNPTMDDFLKAMQTNTFLIKDGMGIGEGIVIKNYQFVNKYGRVTWAKLINNEFKESRSKKNNVKKIGKDTLEEKIIEEFLTESLIQKEKAKIINEYGEFNSSLIYKILNVIWHEFITEEIWQIIKQYKNPVIDFNRLYRLSIKRIKGVLDI